MQTAPSQAESNGPGVTVRGGLRPLTPQTAWIELEPDFAGTLSRESCSALRKAGRWRAGDEIWVKTRSWTTRSELLVDLAAAPAPATLPARAA